MDKTKYALIFIISFFCLCFTVSVFGQETAAQKEMPVIGQLFESPVPAGNYYFVKSVITVFGNKWGAQPQSPEELEDAVWEQLVLSFDAFRRNITIKAEEREAEITNLLKGENVTFDWKKDKDAYAKWVKEKTGEEVQLFENQIEYLLQIQRLREQVMSDFAPQVSDTEAHDAFLDEQSNIDLELAGFDTKDAAEEFHKAVAGQQKFWDEQKAKTPDNFKHPGFVTLVFLIDIWKIPRDDLYKMIKMSAGSIYPPTPIYKGYGVFKVLATRPADESTYAKMKYSYQDKVAMRKKYEGLNDWIKKLKQQANIKIYRKGG